MLLVSFWEVAESEQARKRTAKQGASKRLASGRSESAELDRIRVLERELADVRENLQATIEEQQASDEELKSINEELQSANEELQSSNEELETSKEELQSLNEETYTVNSELTAKVPLSVGFPGRV